MGDRVPGQAGALWGDSQGEPDGDESDEYWDDYAPSRRRRAGVALALVGAVGLSAAAVVLRAPHIEARLRTDAVARLQQVGLGELDVDVQLSGRDATVRGRVPNVEMHRLVVDHVAAVRGVRIVKDKVAVVPGSEASAPVFLSLPLTVTLREGRITFSGTVPTGTVRDILVDRASAAVGGDSVSSVVDRLTVRPQTNNGELASYRRLGGFIARLPRLGADEIEVTATARSVTLRGTAVSRSARADILLAAESLVGDPQLVDAKAFGPLSADGTTNTTAAVAPTTVAPSTVAPTTVTVSRRTRPTAALATTPITDTTIERPVASVADIARAQSRTKDILAVARIVFAPDSDQLTDAAEKSVLKIGETLRELPAVLVTVEGHTDTNGAAAKNLALSRRRAERVRTVLIASGVSPDRVTATGYGSSQPLVSNDTVANRAKNRRIEISYG